MDRDRDHSRERLGENGIYGASTIQPKRAVGTRIAEYLLAVAIFAGALVLWIGIPLASLWVVSKLVEDALTVWLIVLIVCPLSMLLFAGFLARLDDLHLRLSGARPVTSGALLRGLTGDALRAPRRSVLEVSMLVSVCVALAALFVWYFFFAHGG